MNQLKNIHNDNREKFFKFIFAAILKIAGYSILFSINWKIAVAIMLIEKSGELFWLSK